MFLRMKCEAVGVCRCSLHVFLHLKYQSVGVMSMRFVCFYMSNVSLAGISGVVPELSQNRPQKAHFEHFWSQSQNSARIGFRRLILIFSGVSLKAEPE